MCNIVRVRTQPVNGWFYVIEYPTRLIRCQQHRISTSLCGQIILYIVLFLYCLYTASNLSPVVGSSRIENCASKVSIILLLLFQISLSSGFNSLPDKRNARRRIHIDNHRKSLVGYSFMTVLCTFYKITSKVVQCTGQQRSWLHSGAVCVCVHGFLLCCTDTIMLSKI